MGVSDNVKAILSLANTNVNELAGYFNKNPQVMRNKLHLGSFSARDLALIAAFVGGELSIKLPNGQKILFQESDFPKPSKAKSLAE